MPKKHQNQLLFPCVWRTALFPIQTSLQLFLTTQHQTAVTHLHGGAEGCCLQCRCLRCNPSCTEAAPVPAARKRSNKISCSWHTAEQLLALLFLFPSLLPASHPQCPSTQPVSSPKPEISQCEADRAADRVLSLPVSTWRSIRCLAIQLSICEHLKRAARPVLISTHKTGNASC